MRFNRDVLIAYANSGRDRRVNGAVILFIPVMMLFSGFVYYFSSESLVKAVVVTAIFLLLYLAETLLFMGKFSLTNGYNFLYTAISFGLLSINLLTVSNSCFVHATGDYLFPMLTVLVYIIGYALFIYLCLIRLTKLTVKQIKNNETKMSAMGIPSVGGACAVLISRMVMASADKINNQTVFIFLSIVLYLFAVISMLATASILKFIIIKKLKL